MVSFFKSKQNKGQVMIIAVLFFICISVIVVFGLANPVVRHIAMATSIAASKESFYTAEAGIEDAVYRLKAGLPISPIHTLTLGNNAALVTITDDLGNKLISSVGDANAYVRKVETEVAAGSGASFHYGLQTGTGGISMNNNSIVNGNVYANGDIAGGSGARITGSAYAANTAALLADQANESPIPPSGSIQFGHSSAAEDLAQSFEISQTLAINKISVYIRKVGTPGNLTVKIVGDNGGNPGTNVVTQGTLSASLVTGSLSWVEVPFSSNPELNAGESYWFVLDGGNNSSRYYIVGANSDYPNGGAKIGKFGSSWGATSPAGLDSYFKIFLGGLTGSIANVLVGSGTEGDARAHTVNNSIVSGSLYCQTGSGNNKSCDTSLSDPAPEPYPISDGNIEEWKEASLIGGVTNGDVNLSGETSSLGPRKINGNLSITNNHILNVTGTIWVTGNINISNGVTVNLSSSYGSNSGVIIADGTINVSNNSSFYGSGQAGSYILLLTTSASGNAINVANNAGTVVLNAQKGTISFANNAGAKSATAKQINLSNGAIVDYDSGLININFSNGPSGGYNILRWREIE